MSYPRFSEYKRVGRFHRILANNMEKNPKLLAKKPQEMQDFVNHILELRDKEKNNELQSIE